jgi:hypothetical protein
MGPDGPYGHEVVWDQKTGMSAAVSLDPEDARKALEAYEKLGGQMGDLLDKKS